MTRGTAISAAEFEERLAALCRGADSGFPRKQRDRHIIFRSIVQSIGAEQFSEPFLNAALKQWIDRVGAGMGVDHVTLRRYLVDAGYLWRDARGAIYRVEINGRAEVEFDSAISRVDSAAVVRRAREEAALRKRQRIKPLEES